MDKKEKPAVAPSLQQAIEQLAGELCKKRGSNSDLSNWLEAERRVADWLQKRKEAEDSRIRPE